MIKQDYAEPIGKQIKGEREDRVACYISIVGLAVLFVLMHWVAV